MFNVSFGGAGGRGSAGFGSVTPGKSWQLDRVLEQGTWLRDELRAGVLVVLPELRVATTSGVQRFRWLAYFQKPPTGTTWPLGNQRLIPIEKDGLVKLLQSPESNLVTRVLAANFLTETFPKEAIAALSATATALSEGDLLASCLGLLANLKAEGVGPHALTLLQNNALPNGIRQRAARYLGATKHEPALEPLIRAARDKDGVVASAAVSALGDFGGQRPADALLALLRDSTQSQRHQQIAASLAQTKHAPAVATLQTLAGSGNQNALDALVNAGLPETFDFFVVLANKTKDRNQQDKITRGLRNAGKEKAFPVLLDMLEKDTLPPPKNHYEVSTLVQELAKTITAETQPVVVKLARSGKVRAMQVLAQAKHESVREPLTELAASTSGVSQRIVIEGLAQHWAAQSVDAFAAALKSADDEVVQSAIRGLGQSKDARTFDLLLPLLEHRKDQVRQSAGYAIQNHSAGPHAAKVAEILLKTSDAQLTSSLVKVLIDADWKDKTAIAKLGVKLQSTKNYQHYDHNRLLRHLSGNAMGPADANEFYGDEQGWTRRWVEWAKKAS
jgi:HEAT repeat protein